MQLDSDDIDILIDLTTIISHNRQNILDKNCAKVIIAYLAFPGTTGNRLYDYIMTDNIVSPENQQKFYLEKFLALPSTYQVNDGNIKLKRQTELQIGALQVQTRLTQHVIA